MRLYLDRAPNRTPTSRPVDAGDEEDCYTAKGRRRGVYLTEEELRGENVVSCTVVIDMIEPYEVTAEGDTHRSFVVPGDVTGGLAFA